MARNFIDEQCEILWDQVNALRKKEEAFRALSMEALADDIWNIANQVQWTAEMLQANASKKDCMKGRSWHIQEQL